MVQIDAARRPSFELLALEQCARPPRKNRLARTNLTRCFREAVRRQSNVDVDFAVFLSGGVDSSLVSAVTRSLHPGRPLKAYTLRFEEESFDEGEFAGTVARLLKMEPVPVWVRPEDLPQRVVVC